MQRRKFSREFKIEAVRLVRERGVSVAQASRDIDVHENVVRKWVKEFGADPKQAFPGHGQMKPEQLEIDRLRREVAKLRAERDILKKAAAYFAREFDMKFWLRCEAPFRLAGGMALRSAWRIERLASMPSAGNQRPLRARSREDEAIMPAVRASFVASARTYGARSGSAATCWKQASSCGLHKRSNV